MKLLIAEAISVYMEGVEIEFVPNRGKVDQDLFNELMICLLEEQLGDKAEIYLLDVKMQLYFYFDDVFESVFNAEDVQIFFIIRMHYKMLFGK